jgi:hypothetical protein
MNFIVFSLLLSLYALFTILVSYQEFTIYKYSNLPNWIKALERTVITLPLIVLLVLNFNTNLFYILSILSFAFILIADIVIPYNFIIGLGLFGLCHITFLINFIINGTNLNPISFGITFAMGLTLYFFLIYKKLSGLLKPLTLIYLSLILINIAFSFSYSTLAFIGYLFFFACDFEIAYGEFVGKFKGYQVSNTIIYNISLLFLSLSIILL